MSWNGWPITYHRLLGWGYLLDRKKLENKEINIYGEKIKIDMENTELSNSIKWTPNYYVFD